MRKALVAALALGGVSSAAVGGLAHPAPVIPVEVSTVDEDALTLRLATAVRLELDRSRNFVLEAGGDAEGLKVTIADVHPNTAGGDQVNFVLHLERGGTRLSVRTGACRSKDLRRCARQVVQAAAEAMRR